MRHRKNQRGFSLLEALVSLGLFMVVMTTVVSVYTPSRQLYTRSKRQTDVQQNARLAVGEMSRHIRMAGYFPENFADPPLPTVDNPILVATDRALAIHGDADGSGTSNAFLFCLDGGFVRRGRAASDTTAAYVCDGEILAEKVTALRFTYYDANGNTVPAPLTSTFRLDDQDVGAVPDLGDTTERGVVRRVVITLTIETEPLHEKVQEYHLNSDVTLRNAG